jgi:thiol:disulfide interchange protein/DsbC/DsbD-like thiol-disulfide interchange protein
MAMIARLPPVIVLVAALVAPIAARAAASSRFVSHEDTVSLISETDGVSGLTAKLGLLFRLSKGWHIYWKDAGDAGAPPQLTLTQPDHATIGVFGWPAPEWLVKNGLGNYVLSGTVLLPFTLSLPRSVPAQGVDLRGDARWLVCSALICVPQQASLGLHLPGGAASPSAHAGLFASASTAEPIASPFAATVSPSGILAVAGKGLGDGNVQDAHFFPDRPDMIVNAAPQRLETHPGGFSLALKPLKWSPQEGLTGVLEITDGSGNRQALTIAPLITAATLGSALLWSAFGALIGGLLLNLMPCVFPVLAIKAISVAQLGGEARSSVRAQALAYTAGVVVTMLAIGVVLESLRAAGAKLGWGFQLQSPAFVTFMAWIVFALGLNLAGVFEFSSRFSGIGSTLAARGGLVGSFATGLVAVAVATPCTAPFMGAAVASALAAPPIFGLGIFSLLGVGMALPFLLLGFFPYLGRLLPRPGQWMIVFRQLLAFPMFATAVWLLWVVAQQAGPTGVLVAAIGAMLLGFALWLLKFHGWLPFSTRLATGIGTLALLPFITSGPASSDIRMANTVSYSAAKLASLRAAGTPVLIDMSAAWCITCLVNERVALDSDAAQAEIRAHHVVVMTGDWTNRDPAITEYLEAQHRDGVPLYVYYPPHQGTPVVLPQILTPSLVQRTLDDDAG